MLNELLKKIKNAANYWAPVRVWAFAIIPLWVLAFIASGLLGMLSPLYGELNPNLISPNKASPQQIEQFGSAALVWIAGGSTVFVSLLVSITISCWTVYQLTSYRKTWIFLLIISMLVAAWAASRSPFSAAWHNQISELKWTIFSVNTATNLCNSLAATTLAALFVASGALVFSLNQLSTKPKVAAQRLKWLLTSAAVSLVIGVLTIGSLHRLPATLVERATTAERQVFAEAIGELLSTGVVVDKEAVKELSDEILIAKRALVRHWVMLRLDPDTPPAVADSIASVIVMRDFSDSTQLPVEPWIESLILQSKDQRSGVEMIDAIEGLALHMASFWGVIFTLAILLFYLPAAAAIVTEQRKIIGDTVDPQPGLLGLFAIDSEAGIFKPILRILVVLSPLLTGVFAEMIALIQALLANP